MNLKTESEINENKNLNNFKTIHNEFLRKLLHFLIGLFIVYLLLIFNKKQVLIILFLLLIYLFLIRFFILNKLKNRFFKKLLLFSYVNSINNQCKRSYEELKPMHGPIMFLIGSIITISIFDTRTSIFSIMLLSLLDPLSKITEKIRNSFFITSIMTFFIFTFFNYIFAINYFCLIKQLYIIFRFNPLKIFLIVLITTFIEFLIKDKNKQIINRNLFKDILLEDNIIIPLISGFLFELIF